MVLGEEESVLFVLISGGVLIEGFTVHVYMCQVHVSPEAVPSLIKDFLRQVRCIASRRFITHIHTVDVHAQGAGTQCIIMFRIHAQLMSGTCIYVPDGGDRLGRCL